MSFHSDSSHSTRRLIEAVRMFLRVSSANDDVAALDELKRATLGFRTQGLFNGTLQASEFLATVDVEKWLAEPAVLAEIVEAGLSELDVRSARSWAIRFVGAIDL